MMKKALAMLLAVVMLTAFCPSFASAGYEAEYQMDLTNCWDVIPGYTCFAAQDRGSGMYTIYDEDFQPVSGEQYLSCTAVSEARDAGVDLFRVSKEEGVNVYGLVNGEGETVVPLEYLKAEYLSDRWQYGIYVEKSDPSVADYKTYEGVSFKVSHYDFYYNGELVMTLSRDEFDGTNYYGYAYGDYLLLRDLERSIHAYDKTGAVSFDGPIENASEFDGWRSYVHVPTGTAAFTAGCPLTADEVRQDLMPDGGVYYDLQGNTLQLENFYSTVYRFDGNYAPVERQGKYGLIDRSGREVIPCEFDSSLRSDWAQQYARFGYIVATVGGKVCFVNSAGQITYQTPYDESVVKGYRGVIRYVQDLTGEYILLTPEGGQLDTRYQEAPELFTGSPVCAVTEEDGSISIIDIYGNTLLNQKPERSAYCYMTGSGHLLFIYVGSYRYTVYRILETETAAVPQTESESRAWVCPECGAENEGNFCGQCGTAKPATPAETGASWICPSCETENEGNFCSNCGTARPAA